MNYHELFDDFDNMENLNNIPLSKILNCKKQKIESFCVYLKDVVSSIVDDKYNKKIINKLCTIIDKYNESIYNYESE